MPAKRTSRSLTESNALDILAQSLRGVAVRPTIYGYKPQAHQIPFHNSKRKGRLVLGGNRSGKTVSGGTEMVDWITGRKEYPVEGFRPPIKARAIGVDFEQGIEKIIKPEIARWIPPSMLKNGSWEDSYQKSSRTLTLTNGSFLEFLSYDQDVDKHAGTSRHCIWFDEEPPEEIFNENLLRLADTGGHWWMTMTPLIDMTWTEDRLYNASITGQNPHIEVFLVDTSQNEYVSPTELEILLEGFSIEEKAARKSGKFYHSSHTIYRQHIRTDTFIDPIVDGPYWDSVYRRKWAHFVMMDHGYANPTAFLWGCFDEDGKIIIYAEYYQSRRLVAENAQAVHEVNANLQIVPEYYVGDKSIANTDPITGTSVQIEYAELGIPIMAGNSEVEAGLNRVANRIKDGLILITRDCQKTAWEMNKYRFDKFQSKKTAARNNLKETPLKRDDHAMDALRYGIVSRPALAHEVELKPFNPLGVSTGIEDGIILATVREEVTPYDSTLGSDW